MIALRFRTFLNYFLALIVLFFILYRSLYVAPNLLESGASLVLYPVIKMQHIVVKPLQKFFKKRKKMDALYQQIVLLQEHNDTLVAENIELNALLTYKENTLELINFRERYGVCDGHLAQVIMKQFSDYEQSFLVDCGAL